MSASRPRRGRPIPPSAQDHFPGHTATITVVSVTALLMAFSVISWVLDNTTLAAVSGTAACTLAADIGRRMLGGARELGAAAGQLEQTSVTEVGGSPAGSR